MKSGTTSLFHYLEEHPEVCMSKIKEPNFFLGQEEYKKGLHWYSKLFEKNHSVAFGEASTNYSKRHRWEGVPSRIFKDLPNVKLIYVVRDPVERVISHYIHNVAHGRERKSFKKAASPDSIYLKTSMYYYQIEEYLKFFELTDFLFVDSLNLSSNTEDTMKEIFRFIGVSENIKIKNINKKHHSSKNKRMKSMLDYIIHSERIKNILNLYYLKS